MKRSFKYSKLPVFHQEPARDPDCNTTPALKDFKLFYLKIIFAKFLSLIVMAFATTAWWSHDTAATDPSLASSKLLPLIPVRDFYADMRAEWAYHSSHDGRYLAWRATRKTKQVVLVKDRTTDREVMRLRDVDYYFWNPHNQPN